jgi:hypothetical protein
MVVCKEGVLPWSFVNLVIQSQGRKGKQEEKEEETGSVPSPKSVSFFKA